MVSVSRCRGGGWNVIAEGEAKARWYATEAQALSAKRGLELVRQLQDELEAAEAAAETAAMAATTREAVRAGMLSGRRQPPPPERGLLTIANNRVATLRAQVRELQRKLAIETQQQPQPEGETWTRPAGTVAYADDDRYKGGFGVASDDRRRMYKIAFDTAQKCWVCSCPGGINRGQCKHLDRYGLVGRSTSPSRKEKPRPTQPQATPRIAPAPKAAAPIAMPVQVSKAPIRRFAKDGEV